MGSKLFKDKSWFLAFFFFLSAGLIFYIYSISKNTPGKYLLPGVLLLTLFHIYPAFYSGAVAFTNDSNGHQLSKAQAISAIVQDSKVPIESPEPIRYQTLIENNSNKLHIIFKYQSNQYWLSAKDEINSVKINPIDISSDGLITKLKGYTILSPSKVSNYISELQNLVVNTETGISFQPQDLNTLELSKPVFVYDKDKDQLTNIISGEIYLPNDNGQMASKSGEVLYPGWKANIGWRNFSSIITDKEIQRPLLAVLIWTFANAFILVFLSFLMGLVLALIFNFPAMKSKRIYRTIFIIPMAIPSVLSLLSASRCEKRTAGTIPRSFRFRSTSIYAT